MLRSLFALGVAVLLPLVAVLEPAAAQEKKVALVVGNTAYTHVSRLDNPVNDAALMADTLRALGFTLVGGGPQLDLDEVGLRRVVQAFGRELRGVEVGLFYYAGHGVQVRGGNYLVPVDANPTSEADVDFQMLDINFVLRQMEGAGTRLNLVILDACRNNPFGGRGLRSANAGLAQMQAPEGTLISFATQPGNVALDGKGRNSPFTSALAETIRKPGLGLFDAFNEVGLAVKASTGGAQQPWVSSSPIGGSFFFAGRSPSSDRRGSDIEAVAVPAADEVLWQAIKELGVPAVFDDFLTRHPKSRHAPEAQTKRDSLKKQLAAIDPAAGQAIVRQQPAAPTAAIADIRRALTKDLTLDDNVLSTLTTDPFFADAPPMALARYTQATRFFESAIKKDTTFAVRSVGHPAYLLDAEAVEVTPAQKGAFVVTSKTSKLLAGNGLVLLGENENVVMRLPDKSSTSRASGRVAKKIDQLQGSIFPVTTGKTFGYRITYAYKPNVSGDGIEQVRCRVAERIKAAEFHKELTGDVYVIDCGRELTFTRRSGSGGEAAKYSVYYFEELASFVRDVDTIAKDRLTFPTYHSVLTSVAPVR